MAGKAKKASKKTIKQDQTKVVKKITIEDLTTDQLIELQEEIQKKSLNISQLKADKEKAEREEKIKLLMSSDIADFIRTCKFYDSNNETIKIEIPAKTIECKISDINCYGLMELIKELSGNYTTFIISEADKLFDLDYKHIYNELQNHPTFKILLEQYKKLKENYKLKKYSKLKPDEYYDLDRLLSFCEIRVKTPRNPKQTKSVE